MINPAKIQASQFRSLDTNNVLIDQRTPMDQLSFIAGYAQLINFYNKNNELNGNWSPFLLKDPVILMAYIANSQYEKHYGLYKNIAKQLQEIESNLAQVLEQFSNDYAALIDQVCLLLNGLFNILEQLFLKMAEWTHHFNNNFENLEIKTYLVREVQNTYCHYLTAFLELRQKLYSYKYSSKIAPTKPFLFEKILKEPTWSKYKSIAPYYDTLGIPKEVNDNLFPPKTNTPHISQIPTEQVTFYKLKGILKYVVQASNRVFGFFVKIIRNAKNYYEQHKHSKIDFPDTALIRTFTETLQHQRNQLNGLLEKHLNFYYRDILKFDLAPAIADEALLEVGLKDHVDHLILPKGYLFNAGVDGQKHPVIYEATQNTILNAARITEVQQITIDSDSNQLFYETKTGVNKVQKDSAGDLISWNTFKADTATEFGFAFATPMLMLTSGNRKISIFIEIPSNTNPQGSNQKFKFNKSNTDFLLSTEAGWKIVDPDFVHVDQDPSCIVELPPEFPPVVKFKKNPDGLEADWPMLKVVFKKQQYLQQDHSIKSLRIDVDVSNKTDFSLYNDFGKLNPTKPFQPFGPIVNVNNSFYIGSQEVFSKPIQYLLFSLNYDQFPTNGFKDYYSAYNNYHNDPKVCVPKKGSTTCTKKEGQGQGQVKTDDPPDKSASISSLFSWIAKIFENHETTEATESITNDDDTPAKITFSEDLFLVQFAELENQVWNPINNSDEYKLFDGENSQRLFWFGNKFEPSKIPSSKLLYPVVPELQNSKYNFDKNSENGYVRMSLSSPSEGFGACIYPQVVNYVALQNATKLSRITSKDSQLASSAPTPYVPKVNAFHGHYQSSHTYDLSSNDPKNPLQLFHYAPNAIYEVKLGNKVELYPFYGFQGALLVGLKNLTVDQPFNLYFELEGGSATPDDAPIVCEILTNTGWKSLTTLSDSTNQFRCSGIITLQVKQSDQDSVTDNNPMMPLDNFWLRIPVTNHPEVYGQTVYMNTNGVSVKRTSDISGSNLLHLPAKSIKGPLAANPSIKSVQQLFATFGGKLPETNTHFPKRVSQRIFNKGRLRINQDFYQLITEQFPEIYYVNTHTSNNKFNIYVLPLIANTGVKGAFNPHVSACTIEHIQTFVNNISSPFANATVQNMKTVSVTVHCDFVPENTLVQDEVKNKINQALRIYLSPWIKSDQKQYTPDSTILAGSVRQIISQTSGVREVESVRFSFGNSELRLESLPPAPGQIYVSNTKHKLNTT